MQNADAQSRFEAVYQAHYRHVLAYARRRVEEQTARDVAAETFAVAWRRFETVPSDHPLAWLYATARRVLANELRSERYRTELTLRAQAAVLAGVPTAMSTAVHADHADHVAAHDELTWAMAQLTPRDQEVLQLTSWEDLDPATAAAVVGCSATAFKVRLHRARRHLREALHRARDGDAPARTPSAPAAPSAPPSTPPSQSTSSTSSQTSSTAQSAAQPTSQSTSLRVVPTRLHSLESHR